MNQLPKIVFKATAPGQYAVTVDGVEVPVIVARYNGRWKVMVASLAVQATEHWTEPTGTLRTLRDAKSIAIAWVIGTYLPRLERDREDAFALEASFMADAAVEAGVPFARVTSIMEAHPQHGSWGRTISLLREFAIYARKGAVFA